MTNMHWPQATRCIPLDEDLRRPDVAKPFARTVITEAGSALPKGAQLSIYTSFDECEAVWRAAMTDCACYAFQSFEWQLTWQTTVGQAQNVAPYIVHLTDAAARTLMILPLGIYRRNRRRMLQFLGGGMTDYHAPVIDPTFARAVTPTDFARLWAGILKRLPSVDVVWLWNMPETIEGTKNPMVTLPGARFFENAYAAALPSSFAAFKSARSNDFFKDTRRRQRRLSKKGRVEIQVAHDVAEAVELVRIMATQKSRRWRETGGRDIFAQPGYLDFYETLTEKWFPSGNIHVCCLRVDGQTVATDWGLVYNRRFYSMMAGYEGGEWMQYSLGRILLGSVVEWCIEEPTIDIFDLTVGGEGYKRYWADHSLGIHEYLAAGSIKGVPFVVMERLKTSLRRNAKIRAIYDRLKRKSREHDGDVPKSAAT